MSSSTSVTNQTENGSSSSTASNEEIAHDHDNKSGKITTSINDAATTLVAKDGRKKEHGAHSVCSTLLAEKKNSNLS